MGDTVLPGSPLGMGDSGAAIVPLGDMWAVALSKGTPTSQLFASKTTSRGRVLGDLGQGTVKEPSLRRFCAHITAVQLPGLCAKAGHSHTTESKDGPTLATAERLRSAVTWGTSV